MIKQTFSIALLSLSILGCQQAPVSEQPNNTQTTGDLIVAKMDPPIAKKVPYEMSHHGMTRIDNYYWMRDDSRSEPEVLAHLEAENEYTEKSLAHTQSFQNELFDELVGRIKKDDATVPVLRNNYWYFQRFEGEKEYPIHARKKETLDAQEEVLLDGNKMAEGHEYFSIGDYSVSTNNAILGYSTDTLSRRVYTIQFKYLDSDKPIIDTLTETNGQIIWGNDNKTVFYIRKDPQTLLGYQVFRHILGTSQKEDELVYEEKDSSFYTSIGKTRDSSTIVIFHQSTTTSGISYLDANKPSGSFKLFHPLEEHHEYSVAKLGKWFYVHTNWDATNFRLMKTTLENAHDKHKWQEVIEHRPEVFLEYFILFNDYLILDERIKGQTYLKVIDNKTKKQRTLQFNDSVYVAGFYSNPEVDSDILRIHYSSMTTPSSIYDIDLKTDEKTLKKQEEILGNFNPNAYKSERIFVAARDGKEIPVSIVYRKDKFKKDGTNPLYQYGYGSYGSTIDPYFSASRLSLLDRGFVFAIAHIRGGQILGRPWYDDGKMFNKENTFNDFIDVTKALVAQKYAAQDKVFAAGGSAGGLLMGAIINIAPELYKGIAAAVPFVDVVTTMLDESIPLTTNEYDEWGNPNNKDAYDYMLSYSPYDNVARQDYPHILVTTGLHDSQVQYFEPMKWVAKLREYKTNNNRLLFKTDMEAGHGGASGRFKRFKEIALEYAFFMDLIGIKK